MAIEKEYEGRDPPSDKEEKFEYDMKVLMGKWARYCNRRLERCKQRGPRKSTISIREFMAIRSRQNFPVNIHLMSGAMKSISADSSTTMGEVFDAVGEEGGGFLIQGGGRCLRCSRM